MKKHLFFIFFILVLCSVARAKEIISPDAPMEMYLVEKTRDGNYENTNVTTKIRNLFLKRLKTTGFHVLDDQDPPFVSKTMEHYGVVRGGRNQSSGIGYVHFSLVDANSPHCFSDSGQEVVLKSGLKTFTWVFDQKKALSMSDKAGAKYALVINLATELIYENEEPEPVYNITLDADLYQADTGRLVFNETKSMVKLASTVEDATWGACQFLSQKLAVEMLDNQDSNQK